MPRIPALIALSSPGERASMRSHEPVAFQRPQAFKPNVIVADGGEVTIRLYDEIDAWGWWGISASEFAQVVDALPPATSVINLHLNSPGGDIFDGVAITNLLRSHKARIRVQVDGLAASIASVIAMAGDELVMAPNSEMMIHDGWSGCRGNAEAMRKAADLLDHLSDNIAGAYAGKAGGTPAYWRELMKAETWFSAEEAVAAGLADAVLEPEAAPAAPAARSFALLDTFKYKGRDQAPGPGRSTPPAPASSPARAQAAVLRHNARKART